MCPGSGEFQGRWKQCKSTPARIKTRNHPGGQQHTCTTSSRTKMRDPGRVLNRCFSRLCLMGETGCPCRLEGSGWGGPEPLLCTLRSQPPAADWRKDQGTWPPGFRSPHASPVIRQYRSQARGWLWRGGQSSRIFAKSLLRDTCK